MGLFFNAKKFAATPEFEVGSTPGVSDVLANMPRQTYAPMLQQMPEYQAPKRTLSDNLGILGDAFAGTNDFSDRVEGREQRAYKMWAHQAENQRRANEAAAQRGSDRDEWTWREQWKRDHADDQFTNYMRSGGIDPASPQGQALYRQRAESMAAPPLMAVDGFDAQGNPTKTFMPRTGMTGQPPAAAGPAVGTVRNGYRYQGGNPNDRNSWVPVGSASPGGGATFR